MLQEAFLAFIPFLLLFSFWRFFFCSSNCCLFSGSDPCSPPSYVFRLWDNREDKKSQRWHPRFLAWATGQTQIIPVWESLILRNRNPTKSKRSVSKKHGKLTGLGKGETKVAARHRGCCLLRLSGSTRSLPSPPSHPPISHLWVSPLSEFHLVLYCHTRYKYTSLSDPVPIMNQNLVSDRFPRVGIWLAQLPFSAPSQLTNEVPLDETHTPESISYFGGGSWIWGLPIKGCGWRKIL